MTTTVYFSAEAMRDYAQGYEDGKADRDEGYGMDQFVVDGVDVTDDYVLGYTDGWYRQPSATHEG